MDDKTASNQGSSESPKSIKNILIKTALDQTLGAAFNNFLFSLFMHGIRSAMSPAPSTPSGGLATSLGSVINWERIDLGDVITKSRADFWGMMTASWRFWPFVSLINFTFVKSVEGRNLVGGLAGMLWGIYMTLVVTSQGE